MSQGKHGLSHKILSGLFWTASGKGAQAILQFTVMTILARLMTPLEFGVIGAALIVVSFSEIIGRVGLGPALVQRAELEERHLGTAFFFSVVSSFGVGALIWISAAPVASFFNYQDLENVLRALAWLFPIRGFGIVGGALAQRDLRFKWLAGRDALCFFIGHFGFGIGLALSGLGVWSLVAANLITAAAKTFSLLAAYPPKSFLPERRAFRELIYFGGGFTLARFANYLALQGDNLVVGRMLGLGALGIYGRAYQLMSTPASLFGQVLDDVLFPSMAKLQDQTGRLASAYLRGVALIGLVMLPASVVAFILAPEIVDVVLGKNWAEVVLPFRILAVGLLFRTSYKMSDSLARAMGAVYRRAWRQGIYAAAVIGGAFVGQFWGIAGVAVGVLTALLINFLLMAQMSLSALGETWGGFLKAHEKAVSLAFSVGLITVPLVGFLRRVEAPPFLILAATGTVLASWFLIILKFAPHYFLGREGMWMLDILKNYVPSNKFTDKFTGGGERNQRRQRNGNADADSSPVGSADASG